MRYRLLGPVTVEDRGAEIDLGPPQDRSLLVILLLRRATVVGADHIIDLLWGETPPRTARHAMHAMVSRLRRRLGDDEIVSTRMGYRMPDPVVDIDQVSTLIAEGRARLARDPDLAIDELEQALSMWFGEPLADVTYEDWAQPEVRRLDELRVSAVMDRLTAMVATGRVDEAIPELQSFVGIHPHRERAWGLLIVALCRMGWPADALYTYRRAERELIEELGIGPSRDLRQLEQMILEEDEALGAEWLEQVIAGQWSRQRSTINE